MYCVLLACWVLLVLVYVLFGAYALLWCLVGALVLVVLAWVIETW